VGYDLSKGFRSLTKHDENDALALVEKLQKPAHADGAGYFKTKTPLPLVFFDSESLGSYKLSATPTTLLINDDGTVAHAWVGKWDEASAMEVAAALK
jgi:hypothetical protein